MVGVGAGGGGGLVAKSCPTLVTPWTIARQAPLSMGFSRQEYWSWLPFPFPGDLPDPGIEPRSPALQADSSLTELQGSVRYEISSKAGKIVGQSQSQVLWFFFFFNFGILFSWILVF